ncbi:MAG: C40 family peptidase [Bacteroidales bacterium]|nr:C40 family peptidase [Bacteroidales bacterium]
MKQTITKPFGITPTSCIPVRKQADNTSELVNQILFGESFEIITVLDDWSEIRCLLDNCTGWVPNNSYIPSDQPGPRLNDQSAFVTTQMVTLSRPDCCSFPFMILPGSSLPCTPQLGKVFDLAGVKFQIEAPVPEKPVMYGENSIEALALIFIHAPYLWGGRSMFGIDSSGLIQLVAKLNGNAIPRQLSEQVKLGEALSFIQDAKAGDLVFFDNEDGEIIHGGIITAPGKIIHAAEFVKEDSIDHAGIFDKNKNKYIYSLRVINRLDIKPITLC